MVKRLYSSKTQHCMSFFRYLEYKSTICNSVFFITYLLTLFAYNFFFYLDVYPQRYIL